MEITERVGIFCIHQNKSDDPLEVMTKAFFNSSVFGTCGTSAAVVSIPECQHKF